MRDFPGFPRLRKFWFDHCILWCKPSSALNFEIPQTCFLENNVNCTGTTAIEGNIFVKWITFLSVEFYVMWLLYFLLETSVRAPDFLLIHGMHEWEAFWKKGLHVIVFASPQTLSWRVKLQIFSLKKRFGETSLLECRFNKISTTNY